MPTRHTRRVLLIGWDAADWKLINPLLDSGKMPALESLVNRGIIGNLSTLRPMLSPMLWNSIATGKRPEKHGILGFVEPDPETGGIRAVTSTSRRVKAIWNILTQSGLRAHQVGWFASHPAEPISGVSVSNLYHVAARDFDQPWPLPAGAIHPPSLAPTFAAMRMHPAEVSLDMALPFMPMLGKPDPNDRYLRGFCRDLAETVTVHNAATWILENEPWDFLAAYYIGLDHFSHLFMNFHPPRMEAIPEELFQRYGPVMTGVYRFFDMLLARLLQLAGPDATVLLVSDHGFHSDHLRPRSIPNEPAGPAAQHRMHGVFAAAGPGLRHDERVYGASLLDITPTILSLFGLPCATDMDGRPLLQIYRDPPRIEPIASWEDVPGECGMHPPDLRVDPEEAVEALRQLVDLGYIEAPGEDQEMLARKAVREQRYNLAVSYLFSRRPSEALPLLEQLVAEWPEELRFLHHMARCYSQLGRSEDAARTLERAPGQDAPGPWTDWIAAETLVARGDHEAALPLLLRAEAATPQFPDLHIRIGQMWLHLRKPLDAERAFRKAAATAPDSPEARLGLARTLLRQNRNEEAADEALTAVGLEHHLPRGHYCLGVALHRTGQTARAILAFETALSMGPGHRPAHRWLSILYGRPGGDAVRARLHAERARPPVVA